MSDTVRIRLFVGTGFAGAKHEDIYEHPRDEWEAMTDEQRGAMLDELATDFRNECIECSAWVIDDK